MLKRNNTYLYSKQSNKISVKPKIANRLTCSLIGTCQIKVMFFCAVFGLRLGHILNLSATAQKYNLCRLIEN